MRAAEWAYILNGTFRIGIINENGQNEVSDVGVGDLWYLCVQERGQDSASEC